MPIYALKCDHPACGHKFDRGMMVTEFSAKKQQGFRFMVCDRCRRKGWVQPDLAEQIKTLAVHRDEFTFYENAPDEILRGDRNRVVTKNEAKALMSEHGIRLAEKDGKQRLSANSEVDHATADQILERWASRSEPESAALLELPPEAAEAATAPTPEPAEQAAAPPPAPKRKKVRRKKASTRSASQSTRDSQSRVDTGGEAAPILASTWTGLKTQAASLGITVKPTLRRPELERLVRERLAQTGV